MSKDTWENLITSLVFGVAGGLIGYGIFGTAQAMCLGTGIGLVAIPVLIFLAATVS